MADAGPVFTVGDRLLSGNARHLPARDIEAYADASGDRNPIHLDDSAAQGVGLPGSIVHGMLVMGQFEAALCAWRAGLTIQTLQTRFLRPLPVGATIHVEGRIAKVLDARSAIVRLSVRDDEGHTICVGDATVSV
ncbi:MaoC/PaaZ C-terminal domain-containing protein [Stappia sp. ES.058]|uniref:MaoC family dehydratase n=1 Tax=Stappia sp. ES.058 TaxID=1881061 RepID=UPI00087AA2A2|nr:MaoC/PaaZ C-terminal domain-containing protein [Stappia sp. ES.058]SDU17636.1 Acyl dehydratase [Stappia sp. ES.058]